jgi:hypothetical protein
MIPRKVSEKNSRAAPLGASRGPGSRGSARWGRALSGMSASQKGDYVYYVSLYNIYNERDTKTGNKLSLGKNYQAENETFIPCLSDDIEAISRFNF